MFYFGGMQEFCKSPGPGWSRLNLNVKIWTPKMILGNNKTSHNLPVQLGGPFLFELQMEHCDANPGT